MSRIRKTFDRCESLVFIPFLVAGDPDRQTSIALAKELIRAGADILEIGMPFSDPVADGPVIQKADERALKGGMNPDHLFDMVRELRRSSDIPIVLLTYYNVVFRRGIARFYREAHEAGIDGILIVDLPPEEADEAVSAAGDQGIDQVFIASGTTSPERLKKIASITAGFLYVVSTAGVTGARNELDPGVFDLVRNVRKQTNIPIAIGFGISRAEHIRPLADSGADAIIVGSAIVEIIERHIDDREAMKSEVFSYVSGLKQVITGSLRHTDPFVRDAAGDVRRMAGNKVINIGDQ
jgi:tryptophan synthase alpha chain